jgi:hypothetical protein
MRDQLPGRLTFWPRGGRLEGKTLPDGLILSQTSDQTELASRSGMCIERERQKEYVYFSLFRGSV